MKHFLVFASLLAYVSAYALYGGYERMFYYYAYLIDIDVNGKPTKIATGCKNCDTFNKFIAYINEGKAPVAVTNDKIPDVDKTAKALDDKELTKAYSPDKIYSGTGKSIPILFEQVSAFVGGQRDKVKNKDLLNGVNKAVQRVQFLRSHANSDALVKGLQAKHPDLVIKTTDKNLFIDGTNNPTKFKFLDQAATAKANPGIDIAGDVKSLNDPSHLANIQSATDARKKIGGC